ncbi:MAG: peptidoglycan DD-metalloendopeptidase family protein [Lachnospiraceae bacterium]
MSGKAWYCGCAGSFIFIILICTIVASMFDDSERNGRYYGTNEWMWPVPDCRDISSYYGKRNSPTEGASTDHKGIDIPCEENTNIVATKDGIVKISKMSGSEGYWIAIEHDEHYTSYYMHCNTLLVKSGQSVTRGQVIALSGNTGVSTGPHCHFSILKDGEYVNPLDYVDPEEEIRYSTTATTGLRNDMVSYAKQFLGNPYVYGGTSLTNGIDCSAFTMRIYEHFNITIPRTAQEQYNASTHISADELMPGDLLFYGKSIGSISHVTMYIGDGKVIHASNSKTGIIISNINYRNPVGYGRFIIANYTDEDLRYLAACLAAECYSNSKEGQYAVGYVILNRVNDEAFPDSVKGVVVAPGQFTSPWNQYLSDPPDWAMESAQAILEGSAPNPIGNCRYFLAGFAARKKGIDSKGINIGDNIFYEECIW